MATKGLVVHAALAYELIQNGSTIGLPSFALAALQQQNADYTPYLRPSDFPLEEFYPGVSLITLGTPSTPGMATLLTQNIFPALQTIMGGGPLPYQVSYGSLQQTATTAKQLHQQLLALAEPPFYLAAEWGEVVDGLNILLLFPQAFIV
jgi:hypothetical protein